MFVVLSAWSAVSVTKYSLNTNRNFMIVSSYFRLYIITWLNYSMQSSPTLLIQQDIRTLVRIVPNRIVVLYKRDEKTATVTKTTFVKKRLAKVLKNIKAPICDCINCLTLCSNDRCFSNTPNIVRLVIKFGRATVVTLALHSALYTSTKRSWAHAVGTVGKAAYI